VSTLEPVSIGALRAACADPFLRWSVPDDGFLGAWYDGRNLVVARDRALRRPAPGPWLLALGEGRELATVAEEASSSLGRAPTGVTVSASAYDALPDWSLRVRGRWDYMLTDVMPDPVGVDVVAVRDDEAINGLLDLANADAFSRPGDPDVHTWLGVYDHGALACVGALTLTVNGGPHLRAITTHPDRRGRGLGTAVSAELTRRGLQRLAPEVTLGVYSDNVTAITLYERLGYRRIHRLVSAAAP
jgi:ribosomal protein S18 acetylase RimI-like enzyme